MKIICEYCEISFSNKYSYKRHVQNQHAGINKNKTLTCNMCKKDYIKLNIGQSNNMNICDNCTNVQYIKCPTCPNKTIKLNEWSYHLRSNDHLKNSMQPLNGNLKIINNLFKSRIITYFYKNDDESNLIVESFLKKAQLEVLPVLKSALQVHIAYKFNLELYAEYVLIKYNNSNKDDDNENDNINISIKSFQSKFSVIQMGTNIEEDFTTQCETIKQKMEEFQEKDSGWALVKIMYIVININKYEALRGSSYIATPKTLIKKQACVNVQNFNDNMCFKWSIISALSQILVNKERTSSYPVNINDTQIVMPLQGITLNFKDLIFPVKVNQINTFENNNNISINVFGWNEEKSCVIGPYYTTKNEKPIHINLLLLIDGNNSHYIWIKDLSR